MNDISEQRPSFFEGEVLSAADLEQLVVYLRDQSARHLLGGHTWGIVAGLQLLEQTAPNGVVDVYLLPGYAVDGYGRAIVVVNPLRLSTDLFKGQPTGPVQVWIHYDEGQTNGARPGFQVCCNGGDAFSRVAESYDIKVGNLSLAKQQSGISVAGETVIDARTAPRLFNDAGPVICDASVPYQDLPLADETKSRWLIPVGQVGWEAGAQGKFVTLVDPSNPTNVIYSRRLRRYAGVVAEDVYAADGLIRLRRRTTGVAGTVTQAVVDAACAPGDLADPSHDDDVENCADGPTPTELVWIEGRMRVTDDVRVLAPGRVELRDASGTGYFPTTTKGSVPTFLQRTDHVAGTSNNADLAIVIGKADAGNNRLLVQQAAEPQQPMPCQAVQFKTLTTRVAVLDSGNVGIGTETPDQLLTIENPTGPAFIHLKDGAVPSELYVGAGELGGVLATTNNNDLRVRTGGTDPNDDKTTRVTVVATGQVGIGTTAPDPGHQVTIEHESTASLLVRTADDAHEAVLRANDAGAMVAANKPGDDLLLGADGAKAYVWVKDNGRVGINQDSPGHDLSIKNTGAKAEIALLAQGGGSDRKMILGAEDNGVHAGANTNHDFRLKTNNATRAIIKADGKVGIGTESPAQELEVRGDIALGPNGQYFAPGGFQNWAVVAGLVDGGNFVSSGPGWMSAHISGTGIYDVAFTTPFPKAPIVTVQLVGSSAFFAIPLVTASSPAGFRVTMWGFATVDWSFNFIALTER